MYSVRLITAFLVISLLAACAKGSKKDQDSAVSGYFSSYNAVLQDYRIADQEISATALTAVIKADRKTTDVALTANEVATKILTISQCLQIDARVLSGLVHTESRFISTAVSPTGAKGFTQFTRWGVREILDQFGYRGSSHARRENTAYFIEKSQACIWPMLKRTDWKTPWEQAGIGPYSKSNYSNRNFDLIKSGLIRDPDYALLYGAIYLKLLVAYHVDEMGLDSRNPLNSDQLKTLYRLALGRYNGEGGVSEDNYVRISMAFAEKIGLSDPTTVVATYQADDFRFDSTQVHTIAPDFSDHTALALGDAKNPMPFYRNADSTSIVCGYVSYATSVGTVAVSASWVKVVVAAKFVDAKCQESIYFYMPEVAFDAADIVAK